MDFTELRFDKRYIFWYNTVIKLMATGEFKDFLKVFKYIPPLFFRNLALHCIGCSEFYDLQDPETTKRPQISHDQSHLSLQRSGSQSGSQIFCDLCSFYNLSWIPNPTLTA